MRYGLQTLVGVVLIGILCASCGTAQTVPLVTRDGLGLALSGQGAVTGVSMEGKPLAAGTPGGFSIIDVAGGGKSVPVTGAVSNGTFTGQAAGLSLSLTAQYEAAPTFIRVHCTIRDLTGGDRGLVVYFGVPVDATGWQWWQDIQTTKLIEAGKTYEDASGVRAFPAIAEYMGQPGLDVGRHSRLYAAAITGPAGLSYAAPLDEFRIYRTGYDGAKKQLYIAYDLALCQETKVPSEASFTFLLQRVDPRWGLRDALSRYYAIYPQFFTKTSEARKQPEGIWMPFEDLENITDSSEFGFRVQEGANNPVYDDLMGVDSLPYYGGGQEFFWVPGYKPGVDPVPAYEKLVELFNQEIEKRYKVKNGYSEVCPHNKDGRCAMADAAPYGHFISQLDSNPAYPYGQALLANMNTLFDRREKEGSHIDGVYYDGLAAGLDYNRDHFKFASFPPIWDPVSRKPLLYNYFSSMDFAHTAAEMLHAQNRVAMTNGAMTSDMFTVPYLDYLGEETGITIPRSGFNFVRSIAYRKPFMTLLKGNYTTYTHADIERYMQRCAAYGVFPGFFDWYTSGTGPGSSYWVHPEYFNRDRDLFRKYIPLCRWIASAGWEPLTLATCDNPRIFVERFGRAADNNLALTLLSESGKAEAGTLILPKTFRLGDPKGLVAFDQISGRKLELSPTPEGLKASVSLAADGFALIQVLPKQAFLASQAALIKDVLAAGRRQMEVDTQRQRHDLPRLWVPRYGARNFTGDVATQDPHGGSRCLLYDNSATARRNGCYTWVNFHQKQPAGFTISAWSRAEGVDGAKDDNYCLRYSTAHVTNYTVTTEHTLQFEPGTHGWQQVSIRIDPTETIDAVMLVPHFQTHKGKVWFDDITVTTDDGKQWVVEPGFEAWDLRPQLSDPLLAQLKQGQDGLVSAAEALAKSLNPMPQLAAIQTASQKLATALQTEADAYGRPIRDLDDCTRIAGLTVAGLYRLPSVTISTPARVVPGDATPVGVRLDGQSDLPFNPKQTVFKVTCDPAWPIEMRSGQYAIVVPASASLGQRVQIKAQAVILVNGRTPIVLENATTAIVAPRTAGDLQIVDITDDGTTMLARLTLQNNGTHPVQCALQAVVPNGWTVSGPATLAVGPQAEAQGTFTFKAPVTATMGRYSFRVSASVPGEKAIESSTAAWFIPPAANRVVNGGFEDNDGQHVKGWAACEKGLRARRRRAQRQSLPPVRQWGGGRGLRRVPEHLAPAEDGHANRRARVLEM
jgi:hypothetical protein